MRAIDNKMLTEYGGDKRELRNAKLLYILMSALLITDWVMPQYFGIHIGFDFTTTRILNMLILAYFSSIFYFIISINYLIDKN